MTPPESALPDGTSGWIFTPKLRGSSWFAAVLMVVFLAYRALVDHGHPARIERDVIAYGVLIGAGVVAFLIFLLNSHVVITRDSVTNVDMLRRARRWTKAEVARVDRVTTKGEHGTRYLVFVGHDGRKLFSQTSVYWDLDAMVDVCNEAALPVTGSFTDVISAYALNRRVQGMTSLSSSLIALLYVAVFAGVTGIFVFLDGTSAGP
jgi:hypothetical protein